ncbi:glutaredoxin family protein [Pseudobacillus wudalianchiensis]|uniref:NrdH-redoxin n=1 Tax=Pseudobacillus wudalianchiensis TaxID=1743143 RepID=A0A1B9AZ92_9BACI|nr:glutaredoxin family protein [Bacillus wudalianchiensis]OCA89106.1 NrdH-redoxin [Bacillus wudalianchiensis]
MKEVYFYTRAQCSLCEEAKRTLELVQEEVAFHIHEINIDESDELTEKYGLMIPVVEMDEEIIQFGHVDYPTIKMKLDS